MAYELYNDLILQGYERVERDDRLLDVFPNETREKGIELWDMWGDDTVEIIRVHIPKGSEGMTKHVLERDMVEKALREHQELSLVAIP